MSSDLQRAMNVAYKLLSLRDRSEKEIRTALQRKKFSPEVTAEAVERLCGKKLLNDEKFAFHYAESLSRNRLAGPRYIEQSLLKKGIARETVERSVRLIFTDPFIQEEKIRQLAAKKGKSLKKGLTSAQRKKRIYDFLIRRGFSSDLVMKFLRPGDYDGHE